MQQRITETELIVAAAGQRAGVQLWRLVEPLVFHAAGSDGDFGLSVQVPAGFVTDFASVPRWLWPIFPPAGRWSRAAVIHDFLYRETSVDRFLADAIFRECMNQCGVPLWRRVAMYYAVRIAGNLCRETIKEGGAA